MVAEFVVAAMHKRINRGVLENIDAAKNIICTVLWVSSRKSLSSTAFVLHLDYRVFFQ